MIYSFCTGTRNWAFADNSILNSFQDMTTSPQSKRGTSQFHVLLIFYNCNHRAIQLVYQILSYCLQLPLLPRMGLPPRSDRHPCIQSRRHVWHRAITPSPPYKVPLRRLVFLVLKSSRITLAPHPEASVLPCRYDIFPTWAAYDIRADLCDTRNHSCSSRLGQSPSFYHPHAGCQSTLRGVGRLSTKPPGVLTLSLTQLFESTALTKPMARSTRVLIIPACFSPGQRPRSSDTPSTRSPCSDTSLTSSYGCDIPPSTCFIPLVQRLKRSVPTPHCQSLLNGTLLTIFVLCCLWLGGRVSLPRVPLPVCPLLKSTLALYVLFMHMVKQRRKVLATGKTVKREWVWKDAFLFAITLRYPSIWTSGI